jgi:hypothetical protein
MAGVPLTTGSRDRRRPSILSPAATCVFLSPIVFVTFTLPVNPQHFQRMWDYSQEDTVKLYFGDLRMAWSCRRAVQIGHSIA